MFPLAFLQEGETAVIVAPDAPHRANIHGNRHRHRNCHYSAPCNDRHCLHHGDGGNYVMTLNQFRASSRHIQRSLVVEYES